MWRDLKDHLQDKHGYQVEAYETGARAGHTIRDILDDLASTASLAFLVHTAEDEQADGTHRPRQNVVHETGLFQGRLGFSRAIALIKEGTEQFSNLQGIDQIRFTNIKETFGEILAVIRREFGDN
jgi:predicted nucleotide-binding protein